MSIPLIRERSLVQAQSGLFFIHLARKGVYQMNRLAEMSGIIGKILQKEENYDIIILDKKRLGLSLAAD